MPQTTQSESRQVGTTTIHVYDDEFFNGFQSGILLYRLQTRPSGFTDTGIYAFICKHSQGVHTTDRYRAGSIAGWFAALYGYHAPLSLVAPTQEAPHV